MAKGPEIPQTDSAEIEILIERLKQNKLEQRDVELIERLLRTVLALVNLLQRKNMSIKRLRDLIFGRRTEKRKTGSVSQPEDKPGEGAATDILAFKITFIYGGSVMNSTIPADLLELKARFETWRTNRKYLREPIPDELWKIALGQPRLPRAQSRPNANIGQVEKSDWIHFVTPRHRRDTNNKDGIVGFLFSSIKSDSFGVRPSRHTADCRIKWFWRQVGEGD